MYTIAVRKIDNKSFVYKKKFVHLQPITETFNLKQYNYGNIVF